MLYHKPCDRQQIKKDITKRRNILKQLQTTFNLSQNKLPHEDIQTQPWIYLQGQVAPQV